MAKSNKNITIKNQTSKQPPSPDAVSHKNVIDDLSDDQKKQIEELLDEDIKLSNIKETLKSISLTVNGWYELIKIKKNTLEEFLQPPILVCMRKVLKKILPGIDDWSTLVTIKEQTPNELISLIIPRMKELLTTILSGINNGNNLLEGNNVEKINLNVFSKIHSEVPDELKPLIEDHLKNILTTIPATDQGWRMIVTILNSISINRQQREEPFISSRDDLLLFIVDRRDEIAQIIVPKTTDLDLLNSMPPIIVYCKRYTTEGFQLTKELLNSIEEREKALLRDILPTIDDREKLLAMKVQYGRGFIVDRIKEILTTILPTITNWDTLRTMYFKIPEQLTELRIQIATHMVTVINKIPATIEGSNTLSKIEKGYPPSLVIGAIEKRKIVVINNIPTTIEGWNQLVKMIELFGWQSTILINHIQQRMKKVLEIILPDIDDGKILCGIYKHSPTSTLQSLIEDRMIVVFKNIPTTIQGLNTLITMRTDFWLFDLAPILTRINEIVSDILSTTTDWDTLMTMQAIVPIRKSTPDQSTIADHILKLINKDSIMVSQDAYTTLLQDLKQGNTIINKDITSARLQFFKRIHEKDKAEKKVKTQKRNPKE
ncbi:MAG TPA: hypothetical protein PLW93_01065 [Candidatus Absconditabacterales bacterium]|nr:hypothetical protein [Candidatus Absconditabacterales bacterium]HNG96842.1 hypothetical protein [Candidatus Absconditabacterales bacterium]